jgi:regulator of replication initiation timing
MSKHCKDTLEENKKLCEENDRLRIKIKDLEDLIRWENEREEEDRERRYGSSSGAFVNSF